MSRRGTNLEGKHDQMVMFTLVELMTHLIFLALILGFALRKEADPVYNALVKKCGVSGEKCQVIPPARKSGKKPGGQGLANCLGSGKLLTLKAQGNGGYAVIPAPGLPDAIRGNPAIAPLLARPSLSRAELGKLGGAARKAANTGKLGQGACNFTIEICRAHGNHALYANQWNFAQQFFNPPGLHACR